MRVLNFPLQLPLTLQPHKVAAGAGNQMNPIDSNGGLRGRPTETDSATPRNGGVARAGGRPTDASSGSEVVGAPEVVSITRTATELQTLEVQLRDLPGIDRARVSDIQRAIGEGRYSIDTNRIIDNLLQIERDLR